MTNTNMNSDNNETRQTQASDERKIVLLMGMGINSINVGGWFPNAKTETETKEIIEDGWNLLDSVDTFVLGRVTFEMWEEYWPLQADIPSNSDFQKRFSAFVNDIQKLVISTTLERTNWKNSRIINEDISTEISRIKKSPGKNIAIVGGAGIAQSLIKLDLVDEYHLYLHPVILGSGRSILGFPENEQKLELINIRKFESGGLRLHYRRIK